MYLIRKKHFLIYQIKTIKIALSANNNILKKNSDNKFFIVFSFLKSIISKFVKNMSRKINTKKVFFLNILMMMKDYHPEQIICS